MGGQRCSNIRYHGPRPCHEQPQRFRLTLAHIGHAQLLRCSNLRLLRWRRWPWRTPPLLLLLLLLPWCCSFFAVHVHACNTASGDCCSGVLRHVCGRAGGWLLNNCNKKHHRHDFAQFTRRDVPVPITHTHTRTRTRTHTYAHPHTHTHAHARTRMYMYAPVVGARGAATAAARRRRSMLAGTTVSIGALNMSAINECCGTSASRGGSGCSDTVGCCSSNCAPSSCSPALQAGRAAAATVTAAAASSDEADAHTAPVAPRPRAAS